MAELATTGVSRRRFLTGGSSFVLAFTCLTGGKAVAAISPTPLASNAAAAAADGHPLFAPNAFIRIDKDLPIRLVMPNVEMGQGIFGTECNLIAEELDVDLRQIMLEQSPPSDELYATPLLGAQVTGGSKSTRSNSLLLRQVGAIARTMLVNAAAKSWGVSTGECTTASGTVHHPPSGRSATYPELAALAAQEPVPEKYPLKDPKDFKLLGKPLQRPNSPGKVNGSMIFGIDVAVPEMMYASVRLCPVAGGKPRSFDPAPALAIPGVKKVVTITHGVGVIAEHFWIADRALDALYIEWDYGSGKNFSTTSLFADLKKLSENGKRLVGRSVGDLKQSGTTFEDIYQFPMLAHAPMEPLNATVHVRPDACEIWLGTQVPTRVVATAAELTNLPPENIILHGYFLGGGFGRRLETDYVAVAIEIARTVPYPVKMIWTRPEDIRNEIPRPPYYDRISAMVDAEGYPVAWHDVVTGPSVAARFVPAALRKDGYDTDTNEGGAEPPYEIANLTAEWVPYEMPKERPIGWWRGVGPTHNLFKVESFIDDLAHRAGKDPVQYRRHLLRNNTRALPLLDIVAGMIGWDRKPAPPIGRGVAVGTCFGSHVAAILEIEVSPLGEIRMRRVVAAVDAGQIMNPNTIEAQIQGGIAFGLSAALYNQLTYTDGIPQQDNFNNYRMLRINEMPEIKVHIVDSREEPGGMGEVGTAIAAPTLGNAIFAATGVRIRQLPVDRVSLRTNTSPISGVLGGIAPGKASAEETF